MNAGIPLPTPEPKAGNISTANGPSNTELFNKIGESETFQMNSRYVQNESINGLALDRLTVCVRTCQVSVVPLYPSRDPSTLRQAQGSG